jgi:8-oxo-dGTP diphosphatase
MGSIQVKFTMQDATLVLLFKGNPLEALYLGYKKTGFGHGKYTGFGGKVEPGESILETAIREMVEETGIHLQPQDLNYTAILIFTFPHKSEWSQRVHVFTSYLSDELPQESSEMLPKWFPFEAIPYDQMWDDGHYWLPQIIAGRSFQAWFTFGPDNATVTNYEFDPMGKESPENPLSFAPDDIR